MTDSKNTTNPPPHAGAVSDERDAAIARLEKALAEAQARNETVEKKLDDHRARLQSLGSGREESMRALAQARSEIERLRIERDELQKQLKRIDGMQTATVTLPEDTQSSAPITQGPLPSIEELMAGLDDMREPVANAAAGHLHMRVHTPSDTDDSEEMLPPDIVFPEEYAATAHGAGTGPISRLLVLLDGERPIKYPLYKKEMTIGRADAADIHIEGNFVSRVHARLVATDEGVIVEDVDSKNGIKVNSKRMTRHVLSHGDVLGIGPLRFRFLDTSVDEPGE